MGSNRKLLFGVLLVVGAVVFWGLFSVINNIKVASTPPTPVPQAVLVQNQNRGRLIAKATMDIPQGSIVTKGMYEMVPAVGGLSTGFITDPTMQADGFITSTRIPKGAQIRPAEDFIGHITETGIAGALRPGTRAMVIAFANKPTLHDLVRIGNFVDINAAFDGQESRTIVEAVRVLAVDVFANDFPQVNAAMRGGFKADIKGANAPVADPAAPGGPGATPTPTAAPAQAPARPDPAITLEVTPAQANTILLAQSSGGQLDFVVLPALPGGLDRAGSTVPGSEIGEDGQPVTAAVRTVSVTRAQIAPYAESKKNAKPATPSGGTRTASAGGGRPPREPLYNPPTSMGNPNMGTVPPADLTGVSPGPTALPPTYDIPIYADGKTVRVETVRRPQE